MKQLLTLSSKRHILIALSILVVVSVAAKFMIAEAVSVEPVGRLSVVLVPNAGTAGTEYVTLEYSGPGAAQLDGWSISSDGGTVKDLAGISIQSPSVLKICEAGSADASCGVNWSGNDVFNDAGDTFTLINDVGEPVVTISYPSSDTSTSLSGDGSYTTEVYGKGDKVRICHVDNKGAYREHNAAANTLVKGLANDKNSHATHSGDIIPDFIHNLNGGLGYFPGNLWPDERVMHTRGCK